MSFIVWFKRAVTLLFAMACIISSNWMVGTIQVDARRAINYMSGTSKHIQYEEVIHGSCRLHNVKGDAEKYYASINTAQVSNPEDCGRCVEVKCSDETKCDTTKTVTAMIVNVCSGCDRGEIEISPDMVHDILLSEKYDDGQPLDVSWGFVQCPERFVSGSMGACLSDGAGESWISLAPTNFKKPIKSFEINDVEATTLQNQLIFASSFSKSLGPDWYKNVRVKATATDGEVASFSLSFSSPGECAEGSVQFVEAGNDPEESGPNGSGGSNAEGGSSSEKNPSDHTTLIIVITSVVLALCVLVIVVMYIRHRAIKSVLLGNFENPVNGATYLNATGAFGDSSSSSDDSDSTVSMEKIPNSEDKRAPPTTVVDTKLSNKPTDSAYRNQEDYTTPTPAARVSQCSQGSRTVHSNTQNGAKSQNYSKRQDQYNPSSSARSSSTKFAVNPYRNQRNSQTSRNTLNSNANRSSENHSSTRDSVPGGDPQPGRTSWASRVSTSYRISQNFPPALRPSFDVDASITGEGDLVTSPTSYQKHKGGLS